MSTLLFESRLLRWLEQALPSVLCCERSSERERRFEKWDSRDGPPMSRLLASMFTDVRPGPMMPAPVVHDMFTQFQEAFTRCSQAHTSGHMVVLCVLVGKVQSGMMCVRGRRVEHGNNSSVDVAMDRLE